MTSPVCLSRTGSLFFENTILIYQPHQTVGFMIFKFFFLILSAEALLHSCFILLKPNIMADVSLLFSLGNSVIPTFGPFVS